MANADDNTASQSTDQTKGKDDGSNAQAEALKALQTQLAEMNQRLETQATILQEAAKRANPPPKQEDQNLYEPQNMVNHMEKIFDTRLRAEKQKDMTIYNLAQEYPEIQTDAKVRQAVLDAQKTVPESIRDTSEGYQLAVLQATSRAGLIPKSQRKTVEDDVSYDGTRRTAAPKKRTKVSDATIMAAQMMGRNTDDPEVMKRLEDAVNRDSYTKYR